MIQPARVTVFCGSSPGRDTVHAEAARSLGKALVARRLGLVTGGGRVGLMGVVADAVLGAGGEAIGVIPKTLESRELAHRAMSELHVVGSMHERKAMMAALGGAFVALPGGMGTLEELFEVLTWAQLGLHQKPAGLLDVAGYYGPLTAFLDHAVTAGFLHPAHRELLLVETDAARLLDALLAAAPPATPAVPLVKP